MLCSEIHFVDEILLECKMKSLRDEIRTRAGLEMALIVQSDALLK